ncbi:helix-turn-helix transcriptional regulator [Companilactobacillus mishanensis]|uniref:helix-turn-helix transcriptional regulator n=1 Tax=Companilactobacillus mishanensis TaxID=2486008 RepID=UPI001296582D|nr:helix-turn-helix transcriptional regulator [Companilactobacillus mishanensis]MQS89828.1 helix-turn-helix transcriptional regulator [Companilactobacillus mishanensis]
MNKNLRFKILLILLSIITIISLVYLKVVIIGNNRELSYFPFYKTMTYLEYAETTGPGFFEFISFLGLSIATIFLAVGRFAQDDRYIYLFLGMFEALITIVLIINISVFQLVHQDINVLPGPALIFLILNPLAAIMYGITMRKSDVVIETDSDAKPPEQVKPIADILKSKREQADVTQQELADMVKVSRHTILRWESGKSHPDMEYMISVAHNLDFPVSEFWEDDDDKMNNEIIGVVKRGKIYQQAAYFLLSVIMVVVVVFGVAYFGRDFHSPYLDRVNPFLKDQIGYVLVENHGQQKAAVIDDEFGNGNIVTINGSYKNKTEFVKVIHKGAYVQSEVRNVPEKRVPTNIRRNLYQISHFDDPTKGLQKLQLSYNKRYI